MADGKTHWQNLVSTLGHQYNKSAYAMSQEPGIATAGAGLGFPKGFTDIPVYLGAGVKGVYDYLRGNEPAPTGESFLEKYEAGWRDAAINLGSLGQETDINRELKEQAAAAPMLATSLASPSIPIPFAGKAFKGGAGGIAGEQLAKAKSWQGKALTGIAETRALDFLTDPIIKAGAAVTKPATKARGAAPEFLANTLNPKSTTNFVKSTDPHILPQLSKSYGVQISKIDDLGEPLYNRFKAAKTTDKGLDVDKFVNKELLKYDISPKGKTLLKEELTNAINYNKKFMDIGEAEAHYGNILKKAKNSKLVEKELKGVEEFIKKHPEKVTEEFIQNRNLLREEVMQGLSGEKLIDAARRIRTNYDNAYNTTLFSGNQKYISQADDIRHSRHEKILKDLTDIDPVLANEYKNAATQSWVGDMGRIFNWFKAEPYIGDLVQSVEALPHATINNAEILGINSLDALKFRGSFKPWFKDKKIQKLYGEQIVNRYRNTIQSLQEKANIESVFNIDTYSNLNNIKSIKDLQKVKLSDIRGGLLALGDRLGYSFQSGARERVIENVILPEAYSQIKAWGRYKEGTLDFNRAVMNHTIKYMEDLGMIAPDSKFVYKSGVGELRTGKHIDDAIQDAFLKMNSPIAKEGRSAALFMTKWVKGAVQAKLQAYNNVVDVFRSYGQTGTITKADRAKLLNGIVEMAEGIAIFGARGAKVPGAFVENPFGEQKPNEVPETVGTYLMGQIADTLKFDSELRNLLREGGWYKMTGMSGARSESIPIIGASAGTDIASALLITRLENVLSATMRTLETGDLSLLGEVALSTITPTDIDILTNVQTTGKILDSQGNEIFIDKDKFPLQKNPVARYGTAITKNLTPDYEQSKDEMVGEADTRIRDKYKKLTFSQVLKDDNFDKLIDDVSKLYPENPQKVEDLVSSIIEDKVAPERTKFFKKLNRDANDLLGFPAEALQEVKALQRLSDKEVAKLAAESVMFEPSNNKTLNLLIKSGKFDLEDDRAWDRMFDEYEKLNEYVINEVGKL